MLITPYLLIFCFGWSVLFKPLSFFKLGKTQKQSLNFKGFFISNIYVNLLLKHL